MWVSFEMICECVKCNQHLLSSVALFEFFCESKHIFITKYPTQILTQCWHDDYQYKFLDNMSSAGEICALLTIRMSNSCPGLDRCQCNNPSLVPCLNPANCTWDGCKAQCLQIIVCQEMFFPVKLD